MKTATVGEVAESIWTPGRNNNNNNHHNHNTVDMAAAAGAEATAEILAAAQTTIDIATMMVEVAGVCFSTVMIGGVTVVG